MKVGLLRKRRVAAALDEVGRDYGTGFSYLALVVPESRSFVAKLFGAYPTIAKLCSLDTGMLAFEVGMGVHVSMGRHGISLVSSDVEHSYHWHYLVAIMLRQGYAVPKAWKVILHDGVVPDMQPLSTVAIGDYVHNHSLDVLQVIPFGLPEDVEGVELVFSDWQVSGSNREYVVAVAERRTVAPRVAFSVPYDVQISVSKRIHMCDVHGRWMYGLTTLESGACYAMDSAGSKLILTFQRDIDIVMPRGGDDELSPYLSAEDFSPGYTYLRMFAPTFRVRVAQLLGAWPELHRLLSSDIRGCIAMEQLCGIAVQFTPAGIAFGQSRDDDVSTHFMFDDFCSTYRAGVARLPRDTLGGAYDGIVVMLSGVSKTTRAGAPFIYDYWAIEETPVVEPNVIVVQASMDDSTHIVPDYPHMLSSVFQIRFVEPKLLRLRENSVWVPFKGVRITAVGRDIYTYVIGVVNVPPDGFEEASLNSGRVELIHANVIASGLECPSIAYVTLSDVVQLDAIKWKKEVQKPNFPLDRLPHATWNCWLLLRRFSMVTRSDEVQTVLTVYPQYYGILILSPTVASSKTSRSVRYCAYTADLSLLYV